MAEWPSDLPYISTLDAYSIEPVDNLARTEMDGGVPRVRRRYSQSVSRVTVAVPATTAELAAFETFVKYEIDGGAAWFDMPIVNGQGTTICQALIDKGGWQVKRISKDTWEITMALIVRALPVDEPPN